MKLDWKKIVSGAVGAAVVAAGTSYTAQPAADWWTHGSLAIGAAMAFVGGMFVKRPQDTAKR